MGHFGASKTLEVLEEHFFGPRMRKHVKKHCEKCIKCKKAKSRAHVHGLHTSLHIPSFPR